MQNIEDDALDGLAASLAVPIKTHLLITVVGQELVCSKNNLCLNLSHSAETDTSAKDWRLPFIDYTVYEILPDDIKEATSVRRCFLWFYNDTTTKMLYRRSYNGLLLRCLSDAEAKQALRETHDNICGAHQPGLKLQDRLRCMGYYWPTMVADAVNYTKKCRICQIHADFIHQPSEFLHPTVALWPIEAWAWT